MTSDRKQAEVTFGKSDLLGLCLPSATNHPSRLLVFLFAVTAALWPRPSGAHEPITTKVRFNKELVRIFERSCLGCHKPGGIAMSLATYEEARPWAKAIKEEILEKRMPPWHAVKGYGEFLNAPELTQREIDLIVNWVEGGAPRGEDKDLPSTQLYSNGWALGKPDLVLKPRAATEVSPDADEYRYLVLPTRLDKDRWLTAVDLLPGNGTVARSAIFYLFKDARDRRIPVKEINPLPASFKLSPSSLILGTWVPGQRAMALPGGAAQLIPAGSIIVAKVHYKGAGEAVKEQSAVGLYFAGSAPGKLARSIAITDPAAQIPAGAAAHRINLSITMQEDSAALAIRPRSHPLVISFQATAIRADGTEEVLVWTRGYRFDWQWTYYFKQPVHLPKGTRVEVIAYLDNSEDNPENPSSPPKQLRWSELTSDPLCGLMVVGATGESPASARQ